MISLFGMKGAPTRHAHQPTRHAHQPTRHAHQPTVHKDRRAGFSLAELLIVIAIIAIIATVALPTYHQHTQKLIYLDGQSKLLQVMAAQQNFFAQHLRYTERLSEELNFVDGGEGILSERGHYRIKASACEGRSSSPHCILLQALPVQPESGQAVILSLDSRGQRTPENLWR